MGKTTIEYPNRPKTTTGYTQKWVKAFLADKATDEELDKFALEVRGKEWKEVRQIFVDMFINKKTKFDDALAELIKARKGKE